MAPPRFLDGVFFLVLLHLLLQSFLNVYIQIVAHKEHPVEHIGQFFTYVLLVGFDVFFNFLAILPLEVLQDFSGFQGKRNGHILRIVKLLPIPGVPEL